MGRPKKDSALDAVGDAGKIAIVAQPATAVNAALDVVLWSSCIAATLEFIKLSESRRAWAKAHPLESVWSASILAGLGPILGTGGWFTIGGGQIPQQVGLDEIKWAIVIGTLGYGTLKYAGDGIANGILGIISNAAKGMGMPI